MGVAEDMAAEQLGMFPHLAFGIKSPSGVVQIDMLLGIQTRILRGAEGIKGVGGIERGKLLSECRLSNFDGCEAVLLVLAS